MQSDQRIIRKLFRRTLPRLLLWTAVVSPGTISAVDFTYWDNAGSITLLKYTGPGGVVEVPSQIDGLPVASVGFRAFYGDTNVTKVVLPETVTSIATEAFKYCSSLTEISLPGNLNWIGPEAFIGCAKLFAIHIPNSVTNLGTAAFSGCVSLTNLSIGSQVPSLEGGVFYYCTNLTEVVIPGSVTNITSFAFGSCYRLESVTVGAGLLTLWEAAFNSCAELSAVRFAGPAPTIYHPPNFPLGLSPFEGAPDVRVYYLPGTEGWGESLGGRPTVPWLLAEPVILGGTVRLTSESFAFRISWATNAVVTIESAEQLLSPAWQPIGTNVLQNGYTDFVEAGSAGPAKLFRVRAN